MKYVLTLALALLGTAALATGKPPASSPSANSTSNAKADSTSTSTASPVANSYGGSSGDAWAVALPGHGSPSYAGMYSICVNGRGVGWNFIWAWSPDMECVKLIAELDRLARTPVPKPTVYPMADTLVKVSDAERLGLYERALQHVNCANAEKVRAHKPSRPTKVSAGCGK